jgi:hypothetical protein
VHAAQYKLGSTIELHVLVHAHHMGRFSFKICPQAVTRTSDCVDLNRCVKGQCLNE